MRTALVIGISNYRRPDLLPPLPGCLNDVDDMIAYFSSVGIGVNPPTGLRDGGATKDAIVSALSGAIAALGAGDELIVHYSGHGAPFPQMNAVHDAICPFDFDWSPALAILDTEIASLFNGIPDHARVSVVADSCYSGGLAHDFSFLQALARARSHLVRTIPVPHDIAAEIAALRGAADKSMADVALRSKRAVLLAACGPKRTAADAVFTKSKRPNGAMTFNLLKLLNGPAPPPSAVAMKDSLKSGLVRFSQVPELHGRVELFPTPFLLR
jgi:hypothetical protein